MLTVPILSSAVLESSLAGVVIGVILVLVITAAMRFIGPVNAATRALFWTVTLLALPSIQVVYFVSHSAQPESKIIKGPAPASPISSVPAPTLLPPTPQAVPALDPAALDPVKFVPQVHWQISAPPDLALQLLSVYAAVVFLLLLRLCVSYLRLCKLRRRTQPAPSELAKRLQFWLARCPTSRPIELRMSPDARSPLAVGWFRPMIVIPEALVLEFSCDDLDDFGVHELAHLRRYDDWTNLFQRILHAFLFFHPAAYYAARKLNFEREIACDDWVISSHETRSYARCLAKVVELRSYQRSGLLLTSGAFFGKRQILKRVESLLDKTRNTATRVSGLSVLAAVIILAVIAIQVVRLPSVVAFTEEQQSTTNIRWSDASHDLSVHSRGDFTFSPDEQSIATISADGFLLIDESEGWSHRRLEIRPDAAGKPEERYFLDGRQKPMDGVGRAWAARTYLVLLRDLGLDAEGRVGRILTARGSSGVLAEIDRIDSDGVKRQYLNQLLEQATLSAGDMQRVADCVRKIGSDSDKADFLLAHQREFTTDELRTSYFRAVNSIQSDNDRRRVLTGFLEADGNSPETARLVGLSARTMSSDSDKAAVLMAVPGAASSNNHCVVLSAARTIASDSDKARVLTDTAYAESDACRAAFFATANTIESSTDRAHVLLTLLKQATLQPQTYRDVAASARGINSDNDKADVLVSLAHRYSDTAFFDAANTIESGNDRARVLNSVLETKPAQPVLIRVAESASGLAGDNEKAEVLTALAKQSHDTEVQAALQKACQKIASDSDYRRVANAIFEGSK